jgi:hypothetical protein
MNHLIQSLVAATALATLALAVPPPVVQAAPKGSSETKTDKANLEEDGYTCGRMGVGGYLCTKKGAPDYVCDNAGTCGEVRVVPPRPPVVQPPVTSPVSPPVVR